MNHLTQDIRYAVRMMLNKPGFSAAAILVLALGIGANSAVFSLVNAFLLKPLAIYNPDELRGIYSRDIKHPDNYRAFSYPEYTEFREDNPAFSQVMAHTMSMVGLTEGETTRRLFADVVSANYFATLGVNMARGRAFSLEDETTRTEGLAMVVSYPFWKRSGFDPEILGRQLLINGHRFHVIGVAPEGFSGTTTLVSPEIFVPLGAFDLVRNDFEGRVKPIASRDNPTLILVGRIKPGLSQQAADARLSVRSSQLAKAHPAENADQIAIARPLSRMSISTAPQENSKMRIPAILLLSLASVILLIASLNLSNMMMARGAARRKEIAVRLAIGGGRSRIVQQLFTEGFLLALLGGAVGLLLAYGGTAALIGSLARLAPLDLVFDPRPDSRVIAATLAFCTLSTVVFSLFPAWRLSRANVSSDLKENSSAELSDGSRRFLSRRNILVIGQLSLSLMMLTAAGLFIHSAIRAAHIQPGFDMENQIIAEADASLIGYNEARGRQVYAEVQQRISRLPGVQSVGMAVTVPFGMVSLGKNITPSSEAAKDRHSVNASFNVTSGDYFNAMGIPVLRGHDFVPSNHSPVAIIDRLAASKLWPEGDALGKHIHLDGGGPAGDNVSDAPAKEYQIVGIVGDVTERIVGEHMQPHVYIPFTTLYQSDMNIHVRYSVNGEQAERQMLEAVRREIRAVDPRLPVLALKTMRTHLESGADIWIVRTGARILELFGAVALFLAVIGLYAVNAWTVTRRTREIGIRMALGAARPQALGMIMREGLRVTGAGLLVGAALSLGMAQVLAGLLYDVKPLDGAVLTGAPAILLLVSLLACYVPARRASLVDPMVALRCE